MESKIPSERPAQTTKNNLQYLQRIGMASRFAFEFHEPNEQPNVSRTDSAHRKLMFYTAFICLAYISVFFFRFSEKRDCLWVSREWFALQRQTNNESMKIILNRGHFSAYPRWMRYIQSLILIRAQCTCTCTRCWIKCNKYRIYIFKWCERDIVEVERIVVAKRQQGQQHGKNGLLFHSFFEYWDRIPNPYSLKNTNRSHKIWSVTHASILMLDFGCFIFESIIQAHAKRPTLRETADIEYCFEICSEQMPAITVVNGFTFLKAFDSKLTNFVCCISIIKIFRFHNYHP